MFEEEFFSNEKKLYEHYGGMFTSFEAFQNILKKNTGNYTSMLIDYKSQNKEWREKIFKFKTIV